MSPMAGIWPIWSKSLIPPQPMSTYMSFLNEVVAIGKSRSLSIQQEGILKIWSGPMDMGQNV